MRGKGQLGAMGACLAAALVSACANLSVYRPAASENAAGYRDKAAPGGHYLVSFTGTLSMDRDEVRRYARRRAAEATLREGYTHFVIFTARTHADIRVNPGVDFWNPETGYLAGHIALDTAPEVMREFGKSKAPWEVDPGKRTRYTAFADIIVLRGAAAAKNPDAQDASKVLDEIAITE